MRPTVLLAAAFAAAPIAAPAQEIDLTGTWSCTRAEYASGATTPTENIFNLALYRDGTWASGGRFADGSPYQGQGRWRFGPSAGGGFELRVEGRIQSGLRLPEAFAFDADVIGPDEVGRNIRRYGVTTTVECYRQKG